jgi:hypothetical protein
VTGSGVQNVTFATGSWTVPTATCNSSAQTYASAWVGIDGDGSDTVEQTGTDSDCLGEGSPNYYAWYEMYPAASFLIGDPVSPGDSMTASVSVSGTTWTLTLVDHTQGWTFTKVVNNPSPTPQKLSAEWIVEAPSSGSTGAELPLSEFGSVTFTGAEATVNGVTGSIGSFANVGLTMVYNGVDQATVSALGTLGDAFVDTWLAG